MTDSITAELKPFTSLSRTKLMAEVRSNSAQTTLLNAEGENTDAKTNHQRLVFPNASIKRGVFDTRQASISTRRQHSTTAGPIDLLRSVETR